LIWRGNRAILIGRGVRALLEGWRIYVAAKLSVQDNIRAFACFYIILGKTCRAAMARLAKRGELP
jgi:hypothetical protein